MITILSVITSVKDYVEIVHKLIETDWTCSIVDVPENILLKRNEWLAYRQELRDITKQPDPFNIIWPTFG